MITLPYAMVTARRLALEAAEKALQLARNTAMGADGSRDALDRMQALLTGVLDEQDRTLKLLDGFSQLELARLWLSQNPRYVEFMEPPADHVCVGVCLHQLATPYGLFETKDLR